MDKKMQAFTDEELNEVVGGTIAGSLGDAGVFANQNTVLEGTLTPSGKNTLPFMCRAANCGVTFYIPASGIGSVRCPRCKKTYDIKG